MGEIVDPSPPITCEGTKDATTDQIAAKDEEDNNGLMSGGGKSVRQSQQKTMRRDAGIVNEDEVAPVAEEDNLGRKAADEIEEDGGVRVHERDLAGLIDGASPVTKPMGFD